MTAPDPALLAQTLDGWFDDGCHHYPLKAQYEDTDLSGIVFHGRYVAFAERGRSAMLRCCGIDHNQMMSENTAFAVRRMDVVFKAPSRQGEALTVRTSVAKVGSAVLYLKQQIFADDNSLRADLNVEVAVIHLEKGPMRLPRHVHDRIVAMMC